MGDIEFSEGPARAAAAAWAEAGSELRSIADAAAGLTSQPWGGDEIGQAFEKPFLEDRRLVTDDGSGLAAYVESVSPVLSEAATAYRERSSNRA